jgi:tryptophan synthase alpha subunit
MKRIQQLFASTKQPVLNIYCTAGYPELARHAADFAKPSVGRS